VKKDDFERMVQAITNEIGSGCFERAGVMAQILNARILNEIVEGMDALLLELDPEDLTRRVKKGDGDSDVRPLDDSDQGRLQFEYGIDPTAPVDDSTVTLDERCQITQADVRAATAGGGISE